jgi:cytidyltransferase-like protein
MTTVVLATGGFDPIHSGHIALLEEAKQLGDHLVVGVNSDNWLIRKKGRYFMPHQERRKVVQAMACVDEAIAFNDNDNSACDAIQRCLDRFPDADKIIFVNGGDRTQDNIPEMDRFSGRDRVVFAFGTGGTDKKNSSSDILERWKAPRTDRDWGYYRVIHNVGLGVKVKELTVEPGKSLSMQRHAKRSEFWFVAEGRGLINRALANGYALPSLELNEFDQLVIPVGEWHQLVNPYDTPLKVVEIQYGEDCIEEDIERK